MPTATRSLVPALGGLLLCSALVAPPAGATTLDGCLDSSSTIDLNGDGFDDAVVGDPYASVGGLAEAGRITVLFGDADGRIGEGPRRSLSQADFGETAEAGDRFGWSVAVGRADQNLSCASILVGAPGEDLEGQPDAGMAHLGTFDTDDEGQATNVQSSSLTQAGANGAVEAGDEFGYAVALVGPTQPDPYRLVVGSPGESAGTATDAGAIHVFDVQGGPSGVGQYLQGRVVNSGGDRVPGTPQTGDRFGASLAALSLDLGDRAGSIVVGAPGDVVGGRDGAGSVTVLQDEVDDGPFESVRQLTEDSAGVPGVAEAGDAFGTSLALTPFVSGYLPRTLAVGAPGEDRGTVADAGAVTLFTNRDDRLVPRISLTQATTGIPGTVEAGDAFGAALAFRYPRDLLVGVPGEDLGAVADAGIAQPINVAPEEFPIRSGGATIDEDAQGTRYGIAAGSRFGSHLSAITGVRESVFTVSSVLQGEGSVLVDSDQSIPNGGGDLPSRSWVPGENGIPASPGGRFGWAVSGPNWAVR